MNSEKKKLLNKIRKINKKLKSESDDKGRVQLIKKGTISHLPSEGVGLGKNKL